MDLTRRNGHLERSTALKKAGKGCNMCQSTSARAVKGKMRQVQQSKRENWGRGGGLEREKKEKGNLWRSPNERTII